MIVLKGYQEKAVEGLLEDTISLLKQPGTRQKMVLKAPTGSGKTVAMAGYLNRLCEELPDRLDVQNKKIAFIWFAPNQLHLQSFGALKNYFAELRSIKPIMFDEISERKIQPSEVLFLNWQSVNMDKNILIRENENGKNLLKFLSNSKIENTEIIVILDEAHLFASKGKATKEILNKINAKIEIDISATPLYSSDYGHTIKRHEVINEEMIKHGVILNPALEKGMQKGKTLNQVLLDEALKKREYVKKCYDDISANINPLLLIQLPNDSKSESAEDIKIKEEVVNYLESKKITTKNHRLAIWLSNQKENLDNIENADNGVDVLLFKQAISLGWDCPRAAVLLIFREIKQEVFTIQTVGRILRMPEQKHYANKALNYGYVYTNLSKDIIQVVQDDIDYIISNKALRNENYKSIALNSSFINRRLTRNRLGSTYRKFLYKSAEEYLGVTRDIEKGGTSGIIVFNNNKLQERFLETDVKSIDIPLPKNVMISGEKQIVATSDKAHFAKSQEELDVLFRQFCRNQVGAYAKVDSTPVLELALKMFFDEYLELDESDAIKIILYQNNQSKFVELIEQSLEKYSDFLHQNASELSIRIDNTEWDVPVERTYNDNYIERSVKSHILTPFYESKLASLPEKNFVSFLELNSKHIEWWYKNGDKNKEDFSVTYTDSNGILRGFYVDFIIKVDTSTIALFDTKTLDSDKEFCNKHNALIDYLSDNSTKKLNLIGGVIVPKGEGASTIWKYSKNKISNAKETKGWVSFEPSML